ncbi:hypothetical protein C6P97_06550 [Burkholderia multivorans]|uniref:Bacteriophage protein n=1 Tax=Burkholderia multivorans TaxID=87883 RepID=A0AB37B2B1_9BURK|nr:hypothetical protein C6P97_06550 [Burkholderia multivorans]PRE55525.1 hypothetical protein C6P99_01315 [Burkholderia multivorans]PRH15809.1 hypothetical protein C6T71_30405 [Burkholderia multivorans]
MGRCAREGALYLRAGLRGGASCEACAGYVDPNRRKTVAWSPSGGRSASCVAFFDGAPASTAVGYATCVEPRDTNIREMSLRIQLSGFGGQDNRKRVCGLLDRLCVA